MWFFPSWSNTKGSAPFSVKRPTAVSIWHASSGIKQSLHQMKGPAPTLLSIYEEGFSRILEQAKRRIVERVVKKRHALVVVAERLDRTSTEKEPIWSCRSRNVIAR